MINLACAEIEAAAAKTVTGIGSFSPSYINLLTADLYALRGNLAFEGNKPGYGLDWFLRVRDMRSGPKGIGSFGT